MKEIFKNKVQLLSILLLIPLVAVGVYLALNPTFFTPRAATPSFSLEPATVNTKINGDFVVKLSMNPQNKKISALDVQIEYDPTILDIRADDIVSTVFGSYPVKSVDPIKGLINISAVAFGENQLQQPVSTPTTFATLPFHVKGSSSTIVTLGKRVMVDSVGQNIVPVVLSQVTVNVSAPSQVIIASQSASQKAAANSSINPIAAYVFTPEDISIGQNFNLSMTSRVGKINGPALLVDGKAYPVKEGQAGVYTWSSEGSSPQIPSKKLHVFQLVAGCVQKTGGQLDCSKSNIGFNPFAKTFNQTSGSGQTPQPKTVKVDLNNDGQISAADVGVLLTVWGKKGNGDFNKDGVIDSQDYGLLLQQLK